MLVRATFISLFSALLVFAGNAWAMGNNCDFKNINFGISQSQLKSIYKLNTMDVATTGEGLIRVGGKEVCDDLPERSVVTFLLLDDHFVQLGIEGNNDDKKAVLLTFAEKVFDKPDPTKKKSDSPKIAMWNKKNQYNVMYNAYTAGHYDFERILITSDKHKDLFEKENKAQDEAYAKENKGKNK